MRTIILVSLLIVGLAIVFKDHQANALSNPLSSGKNIRMMATTVQTRIPASGQKCAVTISNLDVGTKAFPVFTGYGGDGGALTATGIPVCDSTLIAVAACPTTAIVRDAVPN